MRRRGKCGLEQDGGIWWKTEPGDEGSRREGSKKKLKGGKSGRGKKGWKTRFSCCMTDSLPAKQGLSFNTRGPSCGFSTTAHGAKPTAALPCCLLYCIAHTLHVCSHVCAQRTASAHKPKWAWNGASVLQTLGRFEQQPTLSRLTFKKLPSCFKCTNMNTDATDEDVSRCKMDCFSSGGE